MPSQKLLSSLGAILQQFDHLHLLKDADCLGIEEIRQLYHQVNEHSSDVLFRQRLALAAKNQEKLNLDPWLDILVPKASDEGEAILAEGKVATVILAGGQGTRLGWPGPKALYPIFPEQNITLLQILLEKVAKKAANKLPVAVMTSPLNHLAIEDYVKEKNGCGLGQGQLALFMQKMLPLLDEQGNWFLERPGQICMGPDGNGGVFQLLFTSGILEEWKKAGIEYVIIIPIENPLADPVDAKLVDVLVRSNADVVAKSVERLQPDEKVGIFARRQGKLHVVEYSEILEKDKNALDSEGRLAWPYANIGQFAFTIEFIEKAAVAPLPWHIAKKTAGAWGRGEISVAKCETFLFDVLPLAENPKVLLYPRETSYAPLKNQAGDKDPKMVRAHLEKLRNASPNNLETV